MKKMKRFYCLISSFGAPVYVKEISRPSVVLADSLQKSGWTYFTWDGSQWVEGGWIGVHALKDWIYVGREG
jgi:hypothetical protein